MNWLDTSPGRVNPPGRSRPNTVMPSGVCSKRRPWRSNNIWYTAWGRSNNRPAPVKRTFCAVRLNSGIINRRVEPLSLQKTGRVTVTNPPELPRPVMVTAAGSSATLAPSWVTAPKVARMSWLYSILVMWLTPSASAAHKTARCAALLLGGTVAWPLKRLTCRRASMDYISRPIAAATLRQLAMVSANFSGFRHWAPSLQAHCGLSCTSISRPSAPAATAARAMLSMYL